MRNSWVDEENLELEQERRGRNVDSSVSAQYEDTFPPGDSVEDDHSWPARTEG